MRVGVDQTRQEGDVAQIDALAARRDFTDFRDSRAFDAYEAVLDRLADDGKDVAGAEYLAGWHYLQFGSFSYRLKSTMLG